MNSKLLFLTGCIPARILISVSPVLIKQSLLPYLCVIFFIIGISFMILYIGNYRTNAFEAGGQTWWKDIRPIHGMLYITAAIYCLRKDVVIARNLLLLDTVLGLIFFIIHHSRNSIQKH